MSNKKWITVFWIILLLNAMTLFNAYVTYLMKGDDWSIKYLYGDILLGMVCAGIGIAISASKGKKKGDA